MDIRETGRKIFELRKKLNMTQEEFGDSVGVNYRTVSKWERGEGLPDISVIELICKTYGLDMAYLLSDENEVKRSTPSMKNIAVYVCDECDNVTVSLNEGECICHGKRMKKLEIKNSDDIKLSREGNELFIKLNSIMSKNDYISFVIYVLSDTYIFKKLYPECGNEIILPYLGKGNIIWYSKNNSELLNIDMKNVKI